jgi:hypothetical protein
MTTALVLLALIAIVGLAAAAFGTALWIFRRGPRK